MLDNFGGFLGNLATLGYTQFPLAPTTLCKNTKALHNTLSNIDYFELSFRRLVEVTGIIAIEGIEVVNSPYFLKGNPFSWEGLVKGPQPSVPSFNEEVYSDDEIFREIEDYVVEAERDDRVQASNLPLYVLTSDV